MYLHICDIVPLPGLLMSVRLAGWKNFMKIIYEWKSNKLVQIFKEFFIFINKHYIRNICANIITFEHFPVVNRRVSLDWLRVLSGPWIYMYIHDGVLDEYCDLLNREWTTHDFLMVCMKITTKFIIKSFISS